MISDQHLSELTHAERRLLRWSGFYARLIPAVATLVSLGFTCIIYMDAHQELVFLIPAAFAVVLGLSLRVRLVLSATHLIVRSQFRTRSYALEEVHDVATEAYDGWYVRNVGSDGVLGLWMTQLSIEITPARLISLRSTNMPLRKARMIAALINSRRTD